MASPSTLLQTTPARAFSTPCHIQPLAAAAVAGAAATIAAAAAVVATLHAMNTQVHPPCSTCTPRAAPASPTSPSCRRSLVSLSRVWASAEPCGAGRRRRGGQFNWRQRWRCMLAVFSPLSRGGVEPCGEGGWEGTGWCERHRLALCMVCDVAESSSMAR